MQLRIATWPAHWECSFRELQMSGVVVSGVTSPRLHRTSEPSGKGVTPLSTLVGMIVLRVLSQRYVGRSRILLIVPRAVLP